MILFAMAAAADPLPASIAVATAGGSDPASTHWLIWVVAGVLLGAVIHLLHRKRVREEAQPRRNDEQDRSRSS